MATQLLQTATLVLTVGLGYRVLEFRAKTCAGIGLGKLVRCMFRLRIRLASVRASAYSKQIYLRLALRLACGLGFGVKG